MTQEELAERLDVSPDAIGKYERSVSFIRGDLEHRLCERLGWSRKTVLECRADWDLFRQKGGEASYRLLDDDLVRDLFAGSWHDACRSSITFAESDFRNLPDGLAANSEVFQPIYETFRETWAAVFHNGRMVAKWALLFLLTDDEERFRAGRLLESDLSVDRIRQPILPGTYFGYSPALIVAPGHERAGGLLLSSFVSYLEDLARREILLHGIGTVNVTPRGAQICRDLGMIRLGSHFLDPDIGVWDLPGAAIAASIFARRSRFLAHAYSEAFGP